MKQIGYHTPQNDRVGENAAKGTGAGCGCVG